MYEQDIQLARLLLGKLDEISHRRDELNLELSLVQDELDESRRVREERAGYEDVLARAAELLSRPDLKMTSPEIGGLEDSATDLQGQLSELDNELAAYRNLVDELRNRAPSLLEAALAERNDSSDSVIGEMRTAWESSAVQASQASEPDSARPVADETSMAPKEPEPAPTGPEVAETQDGAVLMEPVTDGTAGAKALQQIFTIKDLKTKETFTFGRNAAFIIDATSVLERVPHYDLHFKQLSEPEARDALIADIDRLSLELSGDFYLVFNSWHQPQVDFGNKVEIRNVFGEDEGVKMAANDLIRELAGEMVARERIVCVITGDTSLATSVSGQGVHILPLSEFFAS